MQINREVIMTRIKLLHAELAKVGPIYNLEDFILVLAGERVEEALKAELKRRDMLEEEIKLMDIKWMYYMLPPRSCFTSDKSYNDYVAGMKCEECGADFLEGDEIGLVPHIEPVGNSSLSVSARIIHRSCFEKRRK